MHNFEPGSILYSKWLRDKVTEEHIPIKVVSVDRENNKVVVDWGGGAGPEEWILSHCEAAVKNQDYFFISEEKLGKIEKDFFVRTWKLPFSKEEEITFKYPASEPSTFTKHESDWYILVALEKADKVKIDRHLLTKALILRYRWAIREGYNHQLDPALKNRYDYPRNQNTIKGIEGYIARIERASEAKMQSILSQ